VNDSPLSLTPSENRDYFIASAPHLKPTRADEYRGHCLLHDGRNPGSFAVNTANGLFYCFACGEGGDAYRFHQRLHGVGFAEARDQVWEIVGRPITSLTKQQKKAWAEQRRREQEDEAYAEYWHRGSLLSLEWQLELNKSWLFEADGERLEQLAKAVRRDTRREAELKSLSRAELLSLYRQQNAADPVMAALMIRLGKEDLDDIQAEAATCVRMLEIQAARERRTAA
jgi:hypothetical protein